MSGGWLEKSRSQAFVAFVAVLSSSSFAGADDGRVRDECRAANQVGGATDVNGYLRCLDAHQKAEQEANVAMRERELQAARDRQAAQEAEAKAKDDERVAEWRRSEDERLSAERRVEDAMSTERAWAEARRRDKSFMRRLWSGQVCINQAIRAAALKEIREEKKYGQIGGVIDKAKIYDLQTQVRSADIQTAKAQKELRSPVPCTNIEMKKFVACYYASQEGDDVRDANEDCQATADLVRFISAP